MNEVNNFKVLEPKAKGSYNKGTKMNSYLSSKQRGALFCLILGLWGLASTPVEAVEIKIPNPLEAETIEEFIQYLIDFIFFLALALVPLMIIIAGFYYLTAAGEPERIKKAKDIILYTSLGLGIILLAKALISVIISALGG